jgi:orotidine-5'-phosphate decarboxylase
LNLVASLSEVAGWFKIGSQLFTSNGPELVRKIVNTGSRVFLDLKFHDIPHQVAGAARSATELGVSMFTVHASGGSQMMRSAVESTRETANKSGIEPPYVIAVSVLTSIDNSILTEIGVSGNANDSVARLVNLAESSGVDGVVSSPQEARSIRESIPRAEFLIVTPGIRPTGSTSSDDQKRVATPQMALSSGASYLVVGRPITGASDPLVATQQILSEMSDKL